MIINYDTRLNPLHIVRLETVSVTSGVVYDGEAMLRCSSDATLGNGNQFHLYFKL